MGEPWKRVERIGNAVSDEERQPFYVRCKPCGHVWIAAYCPMLMDKMSALLKKLMCPNCAGDSKKIFLASKDEAAAMQEKSA